MANKVQDLTEEQMDLLLNALQGVMFTVLKAHGIEVTNPKVTQLEVHQDVDGEEGIGSVRCVYVNGSWACG